MMGNPAESTWSHFQSYVIAKLPQLEHIDGTEITKSMRITACQNLPAMEAELRELASLKRLENAQKEATSAKAASVSYESEKKTSNRTVHRGDVVVEELESDDDDYEGRVEEEDDSKEMTENTPEVRTQVGHEFSSACT